MSLRTSSPWTVSVKGSASEPRRPLGSTAGGRSRGEQLSLDRILRRTFLCLRDVSPEHNTHLEHPVYLNLVSDLVVIHGKNLFHPYHDDYKKRTLTVADDFYEDRKVIFVVI